MAAGALGADEWEKEPMQREHRGKLVQQQKGRGPRMPGSGLQPSKGLFRVSSSQLCLPLMYAMGNFRTLVKLIVASLPSQGCNTRSLVLAKTSTCCPNKSSTYCPKMTSTEQRINGGTEETVRKRSTLHSARSPSTKGVSFWTPSRALPA